MKIKFVFMLTIAILLSACSDDDVFTSTSLENSVKESENLTLQDYPSDTLYYEGQAVIVFHENENTESVPLTRGIGVPTGSEGPFDAPTPKLIQKGKYKKYFIKMSEFDWIPNYSFILMRMNKYSFTITLPNDALPYSVSIKAASKEGFSTEAGGTKGYTLGSIVKTARGYQIPVSFYIQDGAAYALDGKQLCANREMPIPGSQVKYTYTYNLAQ